MERIPHGHPRTREGLGPSDARRPDSPGDPAIRGQIAETAGRYDGAETWPLAAGMDRYRGRPDPLQHGQAGLDRPLRVRSPSKAIDKSLPSGPVRGMVTYASRNR